MKISTKLLFSVFVPLLVALAVGLTLIISYRALETAQDNGDKVRLIRNSITEINHLVFSYVTYPEERPKQQFLAEYQKMTALLAGVRFRNPDQQQLLKEIRLNSQSMKDDFLRLVANTEHSGPAGSNKLWKETEELLEGQLQIRSRKTDSIASALRSQVDNDIRGTQTREITLILLVLGLTTIPVVAVLSRMRKRITTALTKLRQETEVVSSGNLDHVITVEGNDEIEDLTRAFNRMTANLKEVTASKADLEREMAERQKAETELRASQESLKKAHNELEINVAERTEELMAEIEQRKRTEDALRESEEELRYLSSQMLVAQEKERREIAEDLHDNTWQILNTIKLDIDQLLSQRMSADLATTRQTGKRIIANIGAAIERIRTMQGDLWPPLIDDIGLLATINWYGREFEKSHDGMTIEKRIEVSEEEVPREIKIVIYRAMQEALKNVAQHSGANRVLLSLKKDGPRVELEITDNGKGFDLEHILFRARSWAGFGLMVMKERIEHSGGIFDVRSGEGKGTTVQASWSLTGADREITGRRPIKPKFKKQDEPFRMVTEAFSDWVYSMSVEPNGRFVCDWITPGFKLVTGHSIDADLVGILHPEDKVIAEERFQYILALRPYVNEYRIVTTSGEICWVRDSIYPVADPLHPGIIKVIGAAQDITKLKRSENFSRAMSRINELVHSTFEFDEIMDRVLSEAAKAVECETAAISLRRGEEWVIRHVYGFPKDVIGTRMNDEQEPHALLAIRTKNPVVVNDALNDDRVNREHMKKWDVRSVMVVPLITEDRVIGVTFFNHHQRTFIFNEVYVDFAEKLAATVSLALQNVNYSKGLQFELTARQKAEAEIFRQNMILEAVNRVLREALVSRTDEDLGRVCLAVAEELTQSQFGFIGEIDSDGLLHNTAISDPGWEVCTMSKKTAYSRPPVEFKIHGLYGRVLKDGKSLLTNTPAEHPDSIGTPPGHPPLKAFLGVPLIRDDRTIGLIALGNREGGYTLREQESLEALAPAIVQAFGRRRTETAIQRQMEELKAVNEELSRFNRAAVDRELRMVELKKQINELCAQAGIPPRYPLDFGPEQESPAPPPEK